MIVAAEASSAAYALKLIEYWKKTGRPINCFGVGSDAMEAAGFERLGKSEEMAVVGAAEIISHWSKIKATFNSLKEAAISRKPDVIILMDYPEFNIHLAKKLHPYNLNIIYYITPQIWAWRKGRVKSIKKFFKEVFVLFPFELKFFKEKNVPAQFVGHPILDELNEELLDSAYQNQQKLKRGIAKDEILIGLMPGSRRKEIDLNLEVQVDVARKLVMKYPNVKLAVLVAPSLDKDYIVERLGNLRVPYMLIKDEPFNMISMVDYMLATSGTATLMVGLMEKPMVIMYRFNWLTALIAKALVRGTRFFGIVNLISDREIVPERWQEGATADSLFALMSRFIDEPEYTQKVKEDLKQLRYRLGDKGATVRVAQSLEKYFNK